MENLTYQQVLADHYEETAKTVLLVQTEHTEDIPAEDKRPDELEDQDDFKKFTPRHHLESLTKPPIHEDKTVHSVKYTKQTQVRLINIDSRWRNGYGKGTTDNEKIIAGFTNSSSTNFYFKLAEPIKNAISIRLSSIELPNTFYAFSKARGNVWFTVTYPSLSYNNPGTPYTLYIPDGNWDSTSLLQQVSIAMNSFYSNPNNLPPGIPPTAAPGEPLGTSNRFSINLNPGTGKINITGPSIRPGTESIKFDINWYSNGTNYINNDTGNIETVNVNLTVADFGLGYNLGFRSLLYTNNIGLYAESILNTTDTNYLFLTLDKDWKVIFQESPLRSQLTSFAKIIIDQPKFAVVYDNGQNTLTKEYHLKQPTNIVSIPVRLSDPYDQDIDLNGMDFSFTLEISEIIDFSLYETMRN